MKKLKLSKDHRTRLASIATQHGFPSAEAFGAHLVERGLRAYGAADDTVPFPDRLAEVVEAQGYSSDEELVEHLVERGLEAYETPETDPAKLEARLRGLGYID
jgi:hypothetical protein